MITKICVYAIAKNEAKHVYRWHNSIKDADHIHVLDTGSNDSTVQKLQNCGVSIGFYSQPVFQFDAARNEALHNCPLGEEWIYVWLDLDEVMEVGWYDKLVEAVINSDRSIVGWNLRLVNGNTSYNRLAAHRRNYFWQYHAHEVLINQTGLPESFVDITITHLPDNEKPRDYMRLLESSAAQYDDGRSHRYYARELCYVGDYDAAIRHYEIASAKEENQLLLAEIYIELGNVYAAVNQLDPNAKQSYIYAAWTAPYIREGWGALANYCFHTQLYAEAISALHQMLYVTEMPRHTVMVHEPYYHNWWPYHMLASCYYNAGDVNNAKRYIANAIAQNPHNTTIQSDFALINGLTFDTLQITETIA
jgi:tetratricopeptide (TPR) repeat protein